VNAVKNSKIW